MLVPPCSRAAMSIFGMICRIADAMGKDTELNYFCDMNLSCLRHVVSLSLICFSPFFKNMRCDFKKWVMYVVSNYLAIFTFSFMSEDVYYHKLTR